MLTQATISRPPSQQNPSSAPAPTGTIDMIGAVTPFARNTEIYGENERVKYLYRVLKGCVRTSKVLEDGRRQIAAFYLPGDVFGFEAGDRHTLSAEAIVDSQLLALRRAAVAALAARDSSVAGQLWAMTIAELHRAQDQIMLVVRTAQERVAGFLLEMSRRSRDSDHINLPMSRQDIADYLGLTMETVSRALTQFKDAKAIALPTSRHIVLRDREALRRLNA